MPNNMRVVLKKVEKYANNQPDPEFKVPPAAQAQQLAALTLLRNLALFTPVKTGKLAGGWLLRSRGRIPITDANKSKKVSAANLLKIASLDGKRPISVTNNVRYASFVNDGTIKMAPRKFIERAIMATERQLDQKYLGERRDIIR